MCDKYDAFVKDCGLEVLKWQDKRPTNEFALMYRNIDTKRLFLLNHNTCELSFYDLGINLIFLKLN
jgi:hypothetical protein